MAVLADDRFRLLAVGGIMPNMKTRVDFMADSDLVARLNVLVEDRGTTKTKLLVQALKIFLERGAESEFVQLTAKRFDTLSRELAAVRQELEVARREREQIHTDETMLLQGFASFVWCFFSLTSHIPPPDDEKKAVRDRRHNLFWEDVGHRMAKTEAASVASKKKANA